MGIHWPMDNILHQPPPTSAALCRLLKMCRFPAAKFDCATARFHPRPFHGSIAPFDTGRKVRVAERTCMRFGGRSSIRTIRCSQMWAPVGLRSRLVGEGIDCVRDACAVAQSGPTPGRLVLNRCADVTTAGLAPGGILTRSTPSPAT